MTIQEQVFYCEAIARDLRVRRELAESRRNDIVSCVSLRISDDVGFFIRRAGDLIV